MKQRFTTPKLKSYDDLSQTWYVWFRFDGRLIKKTEDINRIKDKNHRLIAGEAVSQAYLEKLKGGWNPLAPEIEIKTNKMSFSEALTFAMEKKKPNLSHKTFLDYSGTVKYCIDAALKINLHYISISDVKMLHVKLILEQAAKDRNWTNKAYNKHLGYLKAVLSELIQWQIIEHNPANHIKSLRVMQTSANLPPHPKQLELIKNTIKPNHPDFWDFILVIYHTGIRPVEITKIQDSMIDRNKRTIILPPTITKTPKERIVSINNHLWTILEPRLGFGKDYYLFGTECPDRGYKKGFKQYVPSLKKMKRDTPTRLWEKIVKKELGFDVNMYSMKKAGANDKIMAGMSTRALKEIFGHSSELTTEIYITKLKDVLHNEIIEKSPEL